VIPILIILLVIVSGTNTLYGIELGYYLPLFLYLYLKHSDSRINIKEVFFFIFLLVVITFQNFLFNGIWKSDALLFFSFLSCFFITKIISKDFGLYFVKIVYFLCVSSLIIWFLLQISEPFKVLLISISELLPHFSSYEIFSSIHGDIAEASSYNAYIYNVSAKDNFRNSGMFFEPGRFAIYICIALAINLFSFKEGLLSRKNILFLITLITTFSTTGYVAIGLIIVGLIFQSQKNILDKILFLILFFVVIQFVSNLDFMAEKIIGEINNSDNYSRFTSVFYHFIYIEKSPWVGFGNYLPNLDLSPNGLSFLILKLGFPFSIVYFFLMHSGSRFLTSKGQQPKYITVLIFVMLLTLAFSQTITTEPFYISIMFMGLKIISERNEKKDFRSV
jgi:hypothetical protein